MYAAANSDKWTLLPPLQITMCSDMFFTLYMVHGAPDEQHHFVKTDKFLANTLCKTHVRAFKLDVMGNYI